MFSYSLANFKNHPDFTVTSVIEDLALANYTNQPADVRVLTKYEKHFLDRGLSIRYLEAQLGS